MILIKNIRFKLKVEWILMKNNVYIYIIFSFVIYINISIKLIKLIKIRYNINYIYLIYFLFKQNIYYGFRFLYISLDNAYPSLSPSILLIRCHSYERYCWFNNRLYLYIILFMVTMEKWETGYLECQQSGISELVFINYHDLKITFKILI